MTGVKREEKQCTSTIPGREPSSADFTPGALQQDLSTTPCENAEPESSTSSTEDKGESAPDSEPPVAIQIVEDGEIISEPRGANFFLAPPRYNRYEPPEALLRPLPWTVARYWEIIEVGDFDGFRRFFLVPDEPEPLPNLGPTLQMTNERGQNFLHVIISTSGDLRFLQSLNGSNSLLAACGFKNNYRPLSVERLPNELPLQQDMGGNTPLHAAASRNNLDFVEGLIKYHMGFRSSLVDLDAKYLEDPLPHSMFRWQSAHNQKLCAYLGVRNHEHRTAAEEASHAGAHDTARWLHDFHDICTRTSK